MASYRTPYSSEILPESMIRSRQSSHKTLILFFLPRTPAKTRGNLRTVDLRCDFSHWGLQRIWAVVFSKMSSKKLTKILIRRSFESREKESQDPWRQADLLFIDSVRRAQIRKRIHGPPMPFLRVRKRTSFRGQRGCHSSFDLLSLHAKGIGISSQERISGNPGPVNGDKGNR